MGSVDFGSGNWLNRPRTSRITPDRVEITTEPETDFWQKSYYGFTNDNAPALLLENHLNFTFSAQTAFRYRHRFDQCGLLVYLDSNNWFKASIEYENAAFSRLGSVVTNAGYSDWATSDIQTPSSAWYRLSRRGPDFLIESSLDGCQFHQMRIFHLQALGETTMSQQDTPAPTGAKIRFGLYACSPGQSSFIASFSDFRMGDCLWKAHTAT